MSWSNRRLRAGLAGLALAAALATAALGAERAGPPGVEKLRLGPALRQADEILTYDRSRVLLLSEVEKSGIMRVDRRGKLDRSFGDEGKLAIVFASVTVAPEGKILVVRTGSAPGSPEDWDAEVRRLLPDGSPDRSFGSDGSALVDMGGRYDHGQTATVAPNGEILLGGVKTTYLGNRSPSDATQAVARLRPNGALDRSFGEDGVRLLPGGEEGGTFDVELTRGGGIVIEGEAELGTAIWKLQADGSLDRGFGKRGLVKIEGRGKRTRFGREESIDLIEQVGVADKGKILLAGTGSTESGDHTSYRVVALRLLPDGRIDRSYGTAGWARARVDGSTFGEAMTVLPQGVVFVAASAQFNHDKRSDVGAVVFDRNGKPDPRFGNRGRFHLNLSGWDLAEDVAAQAGRAVILGEPGKGRIPWLVTAAPH
jgi:uncharacterized delta-60 repeat protein